jgi:hypothetical protein
MANRRLIKVAAAGLVVLAGLLFGPQPARAHDVAPTTLAACATTLPLTTPCDAAVAVSGSTYTVTVPGVGTLTFTLEASGVASSPAATAADGWVVDKAAADGDGAVAVFTNATTGQTYKVDADVRKSTTSTTVQATVRSSTDHICDHDRTYAGTWDRSWDGGTAWRDGRHRRFGR